MPNWGISPNLVRRYRNFQRRKAVVNNNLTNHSKFETSDDTDLRYLMCVAEGLYSYWKIYRHFFFIFYEASVACPSTDTHTEVELLGPEPLRILPETRRRYSRPQASVESGWFTYPGIRASVKRSP